MKQQEINKRLEKIESEIEENQFLLAWIFFHTSYYFLILVAFFTKSLKLAIFSTIAFITLLIYFIIKDNREKKSKKTTEK